MLQVRACLILALVAFVSAHRHQHEHELLGAKENPRQSFWQWVHRHEKAYKEDAKEFEHRFRIWMDNMAYVLEYNSKHTSHWLGLNGLADLSHEEYKSKYALGFAKQLRPLTNRPNTFMYANVSEDTMPQEVDWRKQKAVAEVKNQMNCGSCWAFSTTGAVEGINAIVTKQLLSLSEQELVDCDTSRDKGCSGGLMDFAFEYIIKKGGIHTEDSYPYSAVEGQCLRRDADGQVVTIDGFEDVPSSDEIALKKAVSRQPVSVAIEADQRPFQLYMGGVFDDADCGTELDHGVLVVGYGIEHAPSSARGASAASEANGHNYWIVKNSWGPTWGDGGFIRMRMGRGKEGMCGIAMQPSYPIKTQPNPPAPKPHPKPAPKPSPAPAPEPEPVECDATSECPPSTTCCCVRDLAGFCFTWGCCPMEGATCCDDHEHCCPSTLPVCDTDTGRCMLPPGVAAAPGSPAWAPWATKLPARRKLPGLWALYGGRSGADETRRHRIKRVVPS